jgi:hypothetical protein
MLVVAVVLNALVILQVVQVVLEAVLMVGEEIQQKMVLLQQLILVVAVELQVVIQQGKMAVQVVLV